MRGTLTDTITPPRRRHVLKLASAVLLPHQLSLTSLGWPLEALDNVFAPENHTSPSRSLNRCCTPNAKDLVQSVINCAHLSLLPGVRATLARRDSQSAFSRGRCCATVIS